MSLCSAKWANLLSSHPPACALVVHERPALKIVPWSEDAVLLLAGAKIIVFLLSSPLCVLLAHKPASLAPVLHA
eukprot:159377-Pelagomonas_calceolata.AAC.1